MRTYTDHLPEPVTIPAAGVRLHGTLTLPPQPRGVVLFAHGSGSSRFSPRNRFVAETLVSATIGTLLFDLLTEGEAESRANVFDIALLAERLRAVRHWVSVYPASAGLPVGFFGASTGAAAALVAAASGDLPTAAIVSRGGRPDLAGDFLPRVTAPTLLIVGGADTEVVELNAAALERLGGVKEMMIVPGATHLFEEPGALQRVAGEAAAWFTRYLGGGAAAARKAS